MRKSNASNAVQVNIRITFSRCTQPSYEPFYFGWRTKVCKLLAFMQQTKYVMQKFVIFIGKTREICPKMKRKFGDAVNDDGNGK